MVEARRDECKCLQKFLIRMVIWCFLHTQCYTFVIAEGRKWHWKGCFWLVSNLRSFAYKFSTLQSTLFKCSCICPSSFSHLFMLIYLGLFTTKNMYVFVCVCVCVCLCVCIYIHTYIHAYVLLSFKLTLCRSNLKHYCVGRKAAFFSVGI